MTTIYAEEGYYEQPAFDTEANLETTGLKKFGYPVNNKPMLDIGITEDVVFEDLYGQGYQSLGAGPQVANFVSARFHPVNGKFLYWMLGKRTAATGTRTISNLDYTARKPFLSVWKRSDTLKKHCYGVLFDSCSISMLVGAQPIVTMVGKGRKIASDAFTPTIAWDGASEIDTTFTLLKSMTWDGDPLDLHACTINLRQNSKPMPGYDGSNQDINGQKPVYGTINAVCSSAQGAVAFADWEASSPKSFTFSLGKGNAEHSTHSIVGTFANARLVDVKIEERFGKPPKYNLLAMIQTSSFLVTDGI